MKKLFIVLMLSLAVVGFVSSQTTTYGAPSVADSEDDDSLNIQANVLQKVAVDINPTANATFTLDTNGRTALTVAQAYLVSNYRAWEVKVYSANAGTLVRENQVGSDTTYASSATTANIPYTFAFAANDEARADFNSAAYGLGSSSSPALGAGKYELLGKTIRTGESVNMNITIAVEDETEFWDAGVYKDTIHVVIATR